MTQTKLSKKRYRDPEYMRAGLIYGVLGGFAFAVCAWGIGAIRLANASAGYPWLKFTVGVLLCVMIGGFAGWLTALADNGFVGTVAWFLAGISFCWIASHLPFEGMTYLLNRLDPQLRALHYPYPDNMDRRMVVVYILSVLLFTLAGLLEVNILDAVQRASTRFMRAATYLLVVPFFALAGIVAADYISQPIEDPLIVVSDLLVFNQQVKGQKLDPKVIAEKHYRALAPIQTLANGPYHLYLSSYDPQYFDSFTVLIDFSGQWAECTVLVDSVGNCKPGNPYSNPNDQGLIDALPTPTFIPTGTPTDVASAAEQTVLTSTPAPVIISLPKSLDNAPRYTISADIDVANLTFTGHSSVRYTNQVDSPLDRLYFRLIPNGQGSYGNGRLDVTKALVDGKPTSTQLSQEDTVLEIELAERLLRGQHVQIDLDFNGQIPVDFGGQKTPAGYGIYNYSDHVLAMADWYPILAVYDERGWNLDFPSKIGDSVYSETAFYSVDLTLPKDVIVAASGIQESKQATDTSQILHFETGPMRDFFLIMSPDFQVDSQVIDDTEVNLYYLPGHEQSAGQALKVAADSLHIYNGKFGAYPYSELDIVDAPMRNASGVEFPGIVLVADKLFDTPDNPSFTVATAHEVGHQWWYNVVGNNVFADPWLDEALTSYSSSLYYEIQQGKGAAAGLIDYWKQRYQTLLEQGKDDRVTQSLSHFESLNDPGVYGGVVYTKGALFFDALRQEIGDKAFFNALQNYYQAEQFGIARPEDLLNAFEASAGRSLGDLYLKWLYTP